MIKKNKLYSKCQLSLNDFLLKGKQNEKTRVDKTTGVLLLISMGGVYQGLGGLSPPMRGNVLIFEYPGFCVQS